MNQLHVLRRPSPMTLSVLLCLMVLAIPATAPVFAQSGGTGGGPLAGTLQVTVVEAGSEDGTGDPLPVPGAFVMVGLREGVPFAGNFGLADSDGQITFSNPALSGPQTVTAGAAGYLFYSFVDADAAEVVIPLTLKNPVIPTSQITGSLTSFSGVDCDNWLQSAIVIPPLSMSGLIGFNLTGQLTEEVAIDVLGNTVWVPGNLVIPSQKENPNSPSLCWLLGATISKPSYILYLPTGTTQDLFSFGVKMNMAALMGGTFDLSQIVPLEIGIARNVNVTGNMTVNINMASALNQNLTLVAGNTPASSNVLLLSLGEINGTLGLPPGVGDLVLLDYSQIPGGTFSGAVVRTTPVAAPFGDLRYLAMAVASFPDGLGLSGATGMLDRSGYAVPATRYLTSFFSPVQLDPVAGNLFSFSDSYQPSISPQPDMNLTTLSLVTTVPDTSPGAEPGDTVDVTDKLWTLASPGYDLAFYLPILPPEAPAVLPFPEQTSADDRLVWSQNVVALSLDPTFDFNNYQLDSFPESFTHFSGNSLEFSVDADGDGIHLFDDNCPFLANANQADLDGDGVGDVCDPDKDGDGYQGAVDDCNDLNPAVHPGAPEVCDGVDNNCVNGVDEEPAASAFCDNGVFCDGAEACVSGSCHAGAAPNCSDGIPCTADTCNEDLNRCDHAPNNALCNDGQWCNGSETCNPTSGCQAGAVRDCNDGVSCTTDSCNESLDRCDHVPNAAACNDGLFCTGVESCDPLAGCQPGSGNPCPPSLYCDEGTDTCTGCVNNGQCDDGLYCNGAETCVAGSCQPGTPVSCEDGIPCTSDTCNELLDLCQNAPDDAACSDGQWCNGSEICHPLAGCQAGAASCPDDGQFCNGTESCDEGGDQCLHSGNPCNDGSGCTSDTCLETSDTCQHACAATGPADPCCAEAICSGAEVCETPSCNDQDGDGFGAPASSTCPEAGLDCDDDPSNDPVGCDTWCPLSACGQASCAGCARCINPGAKEFSGDAYDSNCNGNKDCFIATASFGTQMEGKIDVLRSFRDHYLVASVEGRNFVDAYYGISPPIADYMAERGWLKALVRTLLLPVIGLASLFV